MPRHGIRWVWSDPELTRALAHLRLHAVDGAVQRADVKRASLAVSGRVAPARALLDILVARGVLVRRRTRGRAADYLIALATLPPRGHV
jgi:hypothetical protein